MSEKKSHSKPGSNEDVVGVHSAGDSTTSARQETSRKPNIKPIPTVGSHSLPYAQAASLNVRSEISKRPLVQRLLPSGLESKSSLLKSLSWAKSIIVIVTILLLGGAFYAAAIYMPNTPGSIYAQGVENSGKLIDNLATYAQQLQVAPYKSILFNGNMKGSDILGHYDISLSGTEDRNGDGLFSASGNVDSMPLSSSIRTVAVTGSTLPDAYVESKDLDALKPLIGIQGLPAFNQFDGKWILIDHNLLESYLDNLMRIADKHISKSKPSSSPTLEQVSDALTKIQTVSKRYLFTTDSSTAVFKDPVFLETETSNGHQLNHYRVTYNNTHLAAYLQAFGQALDSSQLNAWSQQANRGQNLSQALDLAAMGRGVQESNNTNNTADIWIDRGSKIITKVQLANPSPTLSSMVITQGYNGGKQYPFAITYIGKDVGGTTYTATVNVTLDANTHATTIGYSSHSKTDGLRDDLDAHVSLTPSDATVKVSAPSGAVPFLTALGPSGLANLAKP